MVCGIYIIMLSYYLWRQTLINNHIVTRVCHSCLLVFQSVRIVRVWSGEWFWIKRKRCSTVTNMDSTEIDSNVSRFQPFYFAFQYIFYLYPCCRKLTYSVWCCDDISLLCYLCLKQFSIPSSVRVEWTETLISWNGHGAEFVGPRLTQKVWIRLRC